MKMSDAAREHIARAITPLDTLVRRGHYRAYDFPRADVVKDLDKRYRWDLLHAAGLTGFVCDLYDREGLSDAHIDTALRAIVPTLEGEEDTHNND